jgi:hypothetical protein
MKGMEEMRSYMEEYRRKWERKEGMEKYVNLTCGRGRMEVYDV